MKLSECSEMRKREEVKDVTTSVNLPFRDRNFPQAYMCILMNICNVFFVYDLAIIHSQRS